MGVIAFLPQASHLVKERLVIHRLRVDVSLEGDHMEAGHFAADLIARLQHPTLVQIVQRGKTLLTVKGGMEDAALTVIDHRHPRAYHLVNGLLRDCLRLQGKDNIVGGGAVRFLIGIL